MKGKGADMEPKAWGVKTACGHYSVARRDGECVSCAVDRRLVQERAEYLLALAHMEARS
jgi:hypothetical protein